MEFEQFEALAACHGGDLNRWPSAVRDGARALARSDSRAASVLADAVALDEALDDWRVAPPSMALRDKVMATAPQPRSGIFPIRFAAPLRLWLAGAGLAAGLAGVSCGVVVSTVAVREAQDEAMVAAAVSEGSTAVSQFAEPKRIL